MKMGEVSIKIVVILILALILLFVLWTIIKGSGSKQEGLIEFLFGRFVGR